MMEKKVSMAVVIALCINSFSVGFCLRGVMYPPRITTQEIWREAIPIERIVKERPIPEIRHILEANPAMNRNEARELYETIERVVGSFKSDPNYQGGVARKVDARLILSLIITESNCRKKTRGTSGEIGLTQVMPFHAKNLHRAGILDKPQSKELWDTEKNIRAGVFILMANALKSSSIKEALAKYNAGPKRVRVGMPYAKRVMDQYGQING